MCARIFLSEVIRQCCSLEGLEMDNNHDSLGSLGRGCMDTWESHAVRVDDETSLQIW